MAWKLPIGGVGRPVVGATSRNLGSKRREQSVIDVDGKKGVVVCLTV